MIDPQIESINREDEIKALKNKVSQLEKTIIWATSIASAIVFIAGFFGFNAWSSISGKIDELNKNAEKVETRYGELNKQMLSAGQSNVALNTQLSGLSMEIAKKYDELLQRFTELKTLSSKAQLDADKAITNAGLLVEAVKAANLAAERSQKLAEQAQGSSENAIAAGRDIQKNIQLLDEFLSKNINSKEIKTFKVSVSGNFCSFIISKGNSIPYDRKFTGSSARAYIIVPKGCTVIINDEGISNEFAMAPDVKDSVIFEGAGDLRRVKVGDYYFN